MYIYPDNLKAKPKLWLWELKDIVVIGIGLLFSVLALTNGAGMFLLVLKIFGHMPSTNLQYTGPVLPCLVLMWILMA